MKRMSTIATLILSAFAACGQQGKTCDGTWLESAPTICPNDDHVAFGAFVGTGPQKTLVLTNGSTADLSITGVSRGGAGQFTVDTSETLPADVKGKKYLLARVVFTPDAPGFYQATLNVKSNATKCAWSDGGVPANCGDIDFVLTGCGIEPDAGAPAECP